MERQELCDLVQLAARLLARGGRALAALVLDLAAGFNRERDDDDDVLARWDDVLAG
jgi:hypothetical protein